MTREEFTKQLDALIHSSLDNNQVRTIDVYAALVGATKQVETLMMVETISVLVGEAK